MDQENGYTSLAEAGRVMELIEQRDMELNERLSVWVITGDCKHFTVLVRYEDDPLKERFLQNEQMVELLLGEEEAYAKAKEPQPGPVIEGTVIDG